MIETIVLSIITTLHMKAYEHTDIHTNLKHSPSFVAGYLLPLSVITALH